jgi:hypothetical protein
VGKRLTSSVQPPAPTTTASVCGLPDERMRPRACRAWSSNGSFVNLDRLTAVRFGTGDGGDLTASCEAVGGLSRRYEGDDALALREAMQALCCHGTSGEWAAR